MAKILGLSYGDSEMLNDAIFAASADELGKGRFQRHIELLRNSPPKRPTYSPVMPVAKTVPIISTRPVRRAALPGYADQVTYGPGGIPQSSYGPPVDLSRHVEASELGDQYERLVTGVLAHKLSQGQDVGPGDRARLLQMSGLNDSWHDTDITERIFTASADELGKGGFIGQVSHVVQQAAKVVQPVTKVVRKIQTTADSAMRMAAPLVAKIPVIGQGAAIAMETVANQGDMIAGSSFKNVFSNPGQTLGKILGTIPKDLAAVGGGVATGVADAAGYVEQGASYLGGMADGFLSSGASLFSGFGSDIMGGIKSSNPGLANALGTWGPTINGWGSSLLNASPGTYLGKAGGEIFSLVKGNNGLLTMAKHELSQISPALAGAIPEGGLAPTNAQVQPGSIAGAYGPVGAAQGVDQNPAGVSLPSGPNGAAIPTDSASQALMEQMTQDALNPKSKGPQVQTASVSPFMLLGLAGAAVAAIFFSGRGKSPLLKLKRRRR